MQAKVIEVRAKSREAGAFISPIKMKDAAEPFIHCNFPRDPAVEDTPAIHASMMDDCVQ